MTIRCYAVAYIIVGPSTKSISHCFNSAKTFSCYFKNSCSLKIQSCHMWVIYIPAFIKS